ncbi:MAG: hypothetical protein C4525_11690 [Desulfarculus sp.]|nr:MAG: hypothetical protein C4525_11690 [Desulfarculus sp.]
MRLPVKLKQGAWPAWLCRLLPSGPDPTPLAGPEPPAGRAEFARLVSALKVGATWKTTAPGRHRDADQAALGLLAAAEPTVLDVGAADGVTSLELMEQMQGCFARYYVTDAFLEVGFAQQGRRGYFLGPGGEVLLGVGPRLLAYGEMAGAGPLSRWLAGRLLSGPAPGVQARRLRLVQPELERAARQDHRIVIQAYDVFRPWPGPPLDLIKAANLLNPEYFGREQLALALGHLWRSLRPQGLLLLVDNVGPAPEDMCFSVLGKGQRRWAVRAQAHGGARAAGLAAELEY